MSIYKKIQQKGWSHNDHGQVRTELDRLDNLKDRRPPSGFWKKKYACKKNKGPHEFILVKPSAYWMVKKYKDLNIDEYYKEEYSKYRKEMEEDSNGMARFFGCGFHWKCIHCGKQEYDSVRRPDKKIRNNLKKPFNHEWILKLKI